MEKQKITEERIQYDIVNWFSNTYCLKFHNPRCFIFSVPNDTSDVRELMRKKSTGLKAGVSDLIVLLPEKVLFIEVKTETGTQSEKQLEFQSLVESLGFEYILVRSLSDFQNKIKVIEFPSIETI